jgi:protein-S-isoprenylcysteine O-methyltransferase Ste14
MAGQFDGTGLAQEAAGAYAKSGGLELLLVFFVHAIVAVILLGVIFASANGMKASPGQNLQPFLARGFGASFASIGQAAGKRSDHIMGRSGVVLRAVRVADLQHISRIL